MDETRAVARLPHLDIEIVHRRLPEQQAWRPWLEALPPAPGARLTSDG